MKILTRSRKRDNSTAGFTLIELSIVMAIVGMLTVSMVGLYTEVSKRDREMKTKKEMEIIKETVLGYYKNNLYLPPPDSSFRVPIEELNLAPTAQTDEIYAGKHYAYVVSNNENNLEVDGHSIGNTAMVLISGGVNLKFEEENENLEDDKFTQKGSTPGFDDILVYISTNELESSTAWRRQVEEELAILNQAATLLADNDDDGDGYVDEDGETGICPTQDLTGNCDGSSNWNLVTSIQSLITAGLVSNPDHLVDPWGTVYIWDSFNHTFYSAGPNRTDEGRAGDDISP
jgi:prepilin-type N-terminal cleavage/methylation domain-containing protein